ncbi:MAG: hypothetical protein IPO58_14950 [Betaproteobacteria bacterium]|nr:hypothetical protein [Betaproteobacteria bacterium]
MLGDQATRTRLTEALNNNSQAAARFRDQVSAQLLGRRAYAFQPWYAALQFQLTGDVRYAKYAIEETDRFIASEEEKIALNQRASVAGDSYLEVGQVIGNVALVYDWCHEQLTPAQRERWIAYSNQAVWNVWNPAQARWGNAVHAWTGWSVNNPSNNYYYSFLRATMLLGLATHGENPQAKQWIDHFRVTKIENQLVPAFTRDLEGGGSREGTGYGTAMKNLWQLYDWWERSTGERIATRTPHTLASMAHLMHSIVPTLDRLAPTGDHARDSAASLFDYHREYLLELIALFPDERMSGVAKSLLESSTVPQMKNSFMYVADFLYEMPHLKSRPLDELSTSYWAPGTGQLMMRSSWHSSATYANFICGPYTESHAHRDQGSFVIYKGTWLALDANMFSHSGIEQDEELHNLVRFDTGGSAARQMYGTSCRMAALADTPHYTYASASITPTYGNRSAVVKSEREFLFIKPDTFVVFDRAMVASPATRRIWTLNVASEPKVDGDVMRYVEGRNQLEVYRLAPAGLKAETRSWPEMRKGLRSGVRVDVADANGTASVFLHVLSAGGAVVTATRADVAGQTGAAIKFADGRTATVRFSNQGSGGTIELRAADHTLQSGGTLPTNVLAPPLFAKPE